MSQFFFPVSNKDYILLSAAKISSCNFLSFLLTFYFVPILDKILTPLKGEIKQKQDWFIAFIWEYSLLSYSLTTFKLRASSLHMLGESVEHGWTNKLKALTFVHANQDLPETALTAQVK